MEKSSSKSDFSIEGQSTPMTALLPTTAVKRVITLCLCLTFLAHGFAALVSTSAMSFLVSEIGLSMRAGAMGGAHEGIACMIVALVYGLTCHKMNRLVMLLIACLVSGFVLFVIPLIHGSETQYFVLKSLSGAAAGVIEVSCIAWTLELWDKKSAPYVHGLILFSQMGFFMASILAAPIFSTPSVGTKGRMAHKLAATAMFFASAGLAIMYGKYGRNYQQVNRRLRDEKSGHGEDVKVVAADGSIQLQVQGQNKYWHKLLFVGLGVTAIALSGAVATTMVQFLYPYLGHESSIIRELPIIMYFGILVSSAFLVMSGLSSIKVPLVCHSVTSVTALVVGNLVLLLASAPYHMSASMVWAGFILVSMAQTVFVPIIYSMMEQKVNVTNTVVGIETAVGRLVRTLSAALIGSFMMREKRTFLYFNIAASISIASLLLMFLLMGKKHLK